ncbi:MAG: cytochrome b/b6 domain-containing protein [Dehalococcoidia bacterium]|nr:cytochrome b/b6 domain-containing protein [Dehalococcoidia bacterium]
MAQNKKQRGLIPSAFHTIGDVAGTFLFNYLFDDPERKGVMRFSFPARTFHWTVVILVMLLGLTGLILFVPGWGVASVAGWTRIVHRICVYISAVVLVIYFITYRQSCLAYLKEAFTWTKADLGWVRAAVDYYLGGDESKMPPQGHINPGQKIWELITVVCGALFIITGAVMTFAKGAVAPGVFQWCVFTHDIAFIVGGAMLIVHIVLGTLHPRMSESLRSMITGKISVHYAKSHYGKWYDKIAEKQS